ncbi:MAG: DUF3365 domain-containing protein [Phycisphaerales bacterium]|nr:DUF3365 domain-containing protein [Phycisphaerales bacterium]
MNRKLTGAAMLTLSLATTLMMGLSEPPKKTLTLKEALDTALDDERHAAAFYAAVMEKHGERRPFSNIIHAEHRHEAMLLAQYERLGLTPPKDEWKDRRLDVPDTFAEACDASIVAEIRNGRIYDRLLAETKDEEVRDTFERLQWASLERHLRAFRRHGSGWTEVTKEDLSSGQKAKLQKAEEARNAMFGELLGELMKTLQKSGPAGAIDVCSKRAPEIADAAGKKHGVRIGRTSWKLRNPKNEPPVWAALLVDERPNKERYMVDDNGRFGALMPIRVAGTCLKCHGGDSDLAPGVKDQLNKLYKDDQATGFKDGDLRGWFWVEAP